MSDSQGLIDKRKLRMKRIRAGLTQPALAELAQLDESHIAKIERGTRGVSPRTLNVLADVLGCDITDLMPDEVAA
jgi:transcriptional regulator with XRE-family HTH domain